MCNVWPTSETRVWLLPGLLRFRMLTIMFPVHVKCRLQPAVGVEEDAICSLRSFFPSRPPPLSPGPRALLHRTK